MLLSTLLQSITYESVQGSLRREITNICYHSAKVKSGSLFICLKGFRTDGHEYLYDALKAGAAAVVIEKSVLVRTRDDTILYTEHDCLRISEMIEHFQAAVIVTEDSRKTLAEAAAAFFDYPAKKLRMIGITGTKGKTTTAYLAAAILKEAGYKVGMIGTVRVDDGRNQTEAMHTTPESLELQEYLARMVANGCDCCVMEVSSQGLKMQRVAGIFYEIGVFLNLEPDHIGAGEHESFDEYLICKSKLFDQCAIGIVNRDDIHTDRILRGSSCAVETFSMKHSADYMAEQIHFYMKQGGLCGEFLLCLNDKKIPLKMQLPGMFNVANALAAAAIGEHFSVKEAELQKGLLHALVPGRCENVSVNADYVLLIDYAHNEMSLKNLLEMLRTFSPKRLIVLFGCGGNRSKLRRSCMGETAGHLADYSILTSDNPRWEEPEQILDDIEEGIRATNGAYIRITDRREAVQYAIAQARAGDIIVLAGKGHEEYQEIKGIKYPMSEYELVKDAMARQKLADSDK